ncbi:MAG TPA: nucleotidyl transferase AbiEii/AbiGii toxin family protein [Rhodopila sp.]|jgi:hypothetical protein|nr:nucleotidyl transferase AbiEii/AbiGii toxin family protein [Rhodopila sp.]
MTGEHAFVPALGILPLAQRRLWDELTAVPEAFVLYGGTALALRLAHRQSVDFDFFGNFRFQPVSLVDAMPFLSDATITQQAPDTLTVQVDRGGPVKLSFFGLPGLRRLRQPERANDIGLRVASMLDLAGTKAAVVQQRAEAKDYIDIDAILRDGRVDLPTALSAAGAIYGAAFNPLVTLKALSFFDDGDLHRVPRDVRARLAEACRLVDPGRLPILPTGPVS